MPLKFQRQASGGLHGVLQKLELPLPPVEWQCLEDSLREGLRQGLCRVQDDKHPLKAWTCDGNELATAMVASIACDKSWQLHPDISIESVRTLGYLKADLGIPWFLKSRVGPAPATGVPVLFPFIKSKCYDNAGRKTCSKPGHSCFRRVLDTSQVAFSSAWRTLGRGIRCVVADLNGHEVFDASVAGSSLRMLLNSLEPCTGHCKVCGCNLCGDLQVYACDIDQAFEACSGATVSVAWAKISALFQARSQASWVQVRRGKKYQTKVGGSSWSRGWWKLSLRDLGRALQAAATGTFACIGNLTAELLGMSIGGSMSSSAVSVRLAEEEWHPFDDKPEFCHLHLGSVSWKRYVDDVLAMSYQVCGPCMQRFFASLYSEKTSVVYCSGVTKESKFTWLNYDFYLFGPRVSWTLKNRNRDFLFSKAGAQLDPSFLR